MPSRGNDELPVRIPDDHLDITVFLYPDEAAAREGEHMGGSGFLVGCPVPEIGENRSISWVVTNRHVIERGAWTIRVNTHSGGFETVDTNEKEWFYHPEGIDLALRPLSIPPHFKVRHIPLETLLTKHDLDAYAMGPGDDVYVIGRFVNHAGHQKNTPTVRFGQIAQMPIEKVVCEGLEQESFLVEIRSLGGYSGSPVFVYLTQDQYRPIEGKKIDSRGRKVYTGLFEPGPWLLGVDWCMVPSWEPVCDEAGNELQSGWQVPANTGMMGVVPAWHLRWLLTEYEPVAKLTKRVVEAELKRRANQPPSVLPTGAAVSRRATDENPTHREDFTSLLNAAAKTPPQGD